MSQSKTVIQVKKVFLQYPADGEPGPKGLRVNASDAHRWVDLSPCDALSAYSVPIARAHDFGTKDAADWCNSLFENVFLVREVTVTYEF
jgi:hypothetical protein